MEATVGFGSSPCYYRAPDLASTSCILAAHRPNSISFDPKSHLSIRWLKGCRSISVLKQRSRRSVMKSGIRASSIPSSPIAPLQMESPIGQFLSQILISHPHLLPAAVDQQLQQLETDREAEKSQSGTDLVLYRRIAEVKANERRRVLEEILYALLVQKFVEADVSLIPAISRMSDSSERIEPWSPDEEKLVKLHSFEASEMIKNYLTLILGKRMNDSNSVAPISKLRVGQVYAASVMYGYFLKRVDRRFQLDKSMKTLPWGLDEEEIAIKQAMPDESRPSASSSPDPGFSTGGFGPGIKPCRLRSYVMSLDSETLQRFAMIRSKEAFSIIEKHTEALFGRPEIVISPQGGAVDSSKDEIIKMSFRDLRRLVLEALTFGSLLWDVESYVDSRYRFVAN